MNNRSSVTMMLLVGGGLLSAIATLLGAGGILAGIVILSMSLVGALDNYFAIMGWSAILPGLVLVVPGIVGLRACIRRIRGKEET